MDNKLPNIVDPVTKSTEDVIVCTTKVCAVIVPLIRALEAVKEFLTMKSSAEDAVAAFLAQLAVPNKDPVKPVVAVTDPVTVKFPLTLAVPFTSS